MSRTNDIRATRALLAIGAGGSGPGIGILLAMIVGLSGPVTIARADTRKGPHEPALPPALVKPHARELGKLPPLKMWGKRDPYHGLDYVVQFAGGQQIAVRKDGSMQGATIGESFRQDPVFGVVHELHGWVEHHGSHSTVSFVRPASTKTKAASKDLVPAGFRGTLHELVLTFHHDPQAPDPNVGRPIDIITTWQGGQQIRHTDPGAGKLDETWVKESATSDTQVFNESARAPARTLERVDWIPKPPSVEEFKARQRVAAIAKAAQLERLKPVIIAEHLARPRRGPLPEGLLPVVKEAVEAFFGQQRDWFLQTKGQPNAPKTRRERLFEGTRYMGDPRIDAKKEGILCRVDIGPKDWSYRLRLGALRCSEDMPERGLVRGDFDIETYFAEIRPALNGGSLSNKFGTANDHERSAIAEAFTSGLNFLETWCDADMTHYPRDADFERILSGAEAPPVRY